VRKNGGDVIISFGGANGSELAQVITDTTKLVAAYQSVIDMYNLRCIEFDIEGGACAEKASVDRRNQAITILQKNNPSLLVNYCLPVLPDGLTVDGIYIIQSAFKYGVKIHNFGIMSMDYGATGIDMGNANNTASLATYNQCTKVGYKNVTIKCIPMIGCNDVPGETFTLLNATNVLNFAKANSYIKELSYWEIGRDNYKANEAGTACNDSSGIPQTKYQFASIFKQFQQ